MRIVGQILGSGVIEVVDVPSPTVSAGYVLVSVNASVISAGTEKAKIDIGKRTVLGKARARPDQAKKVLNKVKSDGIFATYQTVRARLDAYQPLGYSCSGVVTEIGLDVSGINVGDHVACAGQGFANHAEFVSVPQNLVVPMSPGISFEDGAYTTLGAIALQGIRQAEPRLGENVLVVGLGLLGLLAVQMLKASGCRVFGIDIDAEAVAKAVKVGADDASILSASGLIARASAFTKERGFDAAIIYAGTTSSEPIITAGVLSRDRGRIVIVGATGMDIPRSPFYEKELEVRLSRSYGPGRYDPSYEEHGLDYPIGYIRWTERRNMEAFLDMISKKTVFPSLLTTHKFSLNDAPDAYKLITGKKRERYIGIILTYDDMARADVPDVVKISKVQSPAGEQSLSLVGAGNFASRVLLPILKADGRFKFNLVMTATGLSALSVAKKFGFQGCAGSLADILGDKNKIIVIATRHRTHAQLTIEALSAGKAVFVEKPLALTIDELKSVTEAQTKSKGLVMAGFNRRFAPFTQALITELDSINLPRAILIRVNAGSISGDHWIQDPKIGGGRIIGEMCHFLDLTCYLAGSRPIAVSAKALDNQKPAKLQDALVATITFENGSVGTIAYLANGDNAYSKERIEVACGGAFFVIDDWHIFDMARNGKVVRKNAKRQDKGHKGEIKAFLDSVVDGKESDILKFRDCVVSTLLSFAVVDSLSQGSSVTINLVEALA